MRVMRGMRALMRPDTTDRWLMKPRWAIVRVTSRGFRSASLGMDRAVAVRSTKYEYSVCTSHTWPTAARQQTPIVTCLLPAGKRGTQRHVSAASAPVAASIASLPPSPAGIVHQSAWLVTGGQHIPRRWVLDVGFVGQKSKKRTLSVPSARRNLANPSIPGNVGLRGFPQVLFARYSPSRPHNSAQASAERAPCPSLEVGAPLAA